MPPDDRFEPRRRRIRPPKSEISSDLFQSIGVRWEIYLGVNERKKICCTIDCSGYLRTCRWASVTFAHAFQKCRFICAVVDQVRVRDIRKDADKFVPY